MGLLDAFDSPEMGMALGLLQAGGPSRTPINFGQALGYGAQGYQEAKDRLTKRDLMAMQLAEAKAKAADAEATRNFDFSKFYAAPNPSAIDAGPPTIAQQKQFTGGLDTQGMITAMMASKSPSLQQSALSMLTKEDAPIALSDGGMLVTKGGKVLASNPKDQSIKEGYIRPDGTIDPVLYEAAKELKATGAPKVSVNPTVKMGDSVATQIGPMMKDARTQVDGAVKMFDAADRIQTAVDSGLVKAGPLATPTMKVKQLFGGDSDSVRQTRQVIKGLAQMGLEARKQLAGQGQVTENEAAAALKADAGNIDDLTVGELRDLVTLTKRASHYTAKSYAEQLTNLGANEGTKNLVPFYQVRGMDALLNHNPTLPKIGNSDGQFKIIGVR